MTPEQSRVLFDAHYLWVQSHIDEHGEPENKGDYNDTPTKAQQDAGKDGMYAAYILDLDADAETERRFDELVRSTGIFEDTKTIQIQQTPQEPAT